MGDPVKQRRCHLDITKDRRPFTELQIDGYDVPGVFMELGDQVEEQGFTEFWKGNVTQFINDDTMGLAELADELASVAFRLFSYQSIDEINSIMEADLLALVDKRCSKGNGDMGLAGSSAAYQGQVVSILCELAGTQLLDPDR